VWQTDRRTDRQTDKQNYDFQDRASIAASRGETAEPIEMPFRVWTRVGRVKHVLDGEGTLA